MNRRRKLLLFGAERFDPDALDYIQRVEAADEQALEPEIKEAINDFVRGLKSDGVWNALKASCILAGARTLSGALIPLKSDMPSPTNVNFVSADYDRILGLKGDASTKLLNSNRNNNADPQNSHHLAAYITQKRSPSVTLAGIIGAGLNQTGTSHIFDDRGNVYNFRSRTSGTIGDSGVPKSNDFVGSFRSSANDVRLRSNGSTDNFTATSQTPLNRNILVFGRDTSAQFDGRISFYSIGENTNEILFENRVTNLMSAYANILS